MYIYVVIYIHIHTCGDIDAYLLVVPQSDPCLVTSLNSLGEKIFFWLAGGSSEISVELFQIIKDDAAALNMPANLENSAVATGLEKVSFHSNPKEGKCQRMLKLLH